MIFLWNDWNTGHIADHSVKRDEAEYVVRHPASGFPELRSEEKFLVHGRATSGRYLQVIYIYPDDSEIDALSLDPVDRLKWMEGEEVAYVIHARELEHDEKRTFRRRRK